MTTSIQNLLDGLPPAASNLMALLSIPESLTDDVALRLYALAPLEKIDGGQFIQIFRQLSFIQPRNSEWSLTPLAREALLSIAQKSPPLVRRAHEIMLDLVKTAPPEAAGDVIPNYIYTLAGKAYHQAGAGKTDDALSTYEQAAKLPYGGVQWLATRLASEQERFGILPPDQVEILFLQAITLFREGHRDLAKPLFERIITKGQPAYATAVALNIIGNYETNKNPDRAENLLRQGIEVSRLVGDDQGIAVGQHNLGTLIGKDRKRIEEAEQWLKKSIEMGESLGNIHHASMVRHSLANLLNKSRHRTRAKEAEQLLRQAIEDLNERNDPAGAGKAMHTLAMTILRDSKRQEEAYRIFRQSIAISEQTKDERTTMGRSITFAKFLIKAGINLPEVRDLLSRAHRIARSRGDKRQLETIADLQKSIAN
ncbi:hypothetical protein [Sphingopyxis sp.]|uniref:hypothetical protein n=1 Tax=Sphingopyxis sp. TaxID=1908224 RepID=UPI0031203A36